MNQYLIWILVFVIILIGYHIYLNWDYIGVIGYHTYLNWCHIDIYEKLAIILIATAFISLAVFLVWHH